MNIFKKIFGNSDPIGKSSGLNKPDIDKLLNSEDVNRSIIELDNYICALCEWGEELNKLTEQQRIFFFNQNLEREVNNGGFDQFYKNSSGNFANETIDSLKAIGAYKTAEIIKKANDQFPEKNVPKDRIKRIEIIEQIEKEASEIWEELSQKFFAYEDDLNNLNMNFIKANKNGF